MSDKERVYIITSLLKTYSNSSLINEEYINEILNTIPFTSISDTIFECKKMINNYLVEEAKKDENILFELAIDMSSIKERICLKLKLDVKDQKYDDYLMEGILAYDGSKDLSLFLSSYLMKKIKMKYIPEKNDKKLIFRDSATKNDNAPTEVKQEENYPLKDTNNKERVHVSEIVKPKELSKKEKQKETIETFATPIEDLDNLLNLDREEAQGNIEDITKDLCEPLDLELKIKEITTNQMGSAKVNILIKLYNLIALDATEDNLLFNYYQKLRFGFFGSYYTLEEIAKILNLSLDEVISYEEYTANKLKELLTANLEKNISLTFK